MANYSVRYWEYQDKKINRVRNTACFSGIYGFSCPQPDKINFICRVDQSLSENECLFYLNFINGIFSTDRYKYKLFFTKKKNPLIGFSFIAKKLKRITSLLYLTAFRYPQEFPEILQKFYKLGKNINNTEQLFDLFQRLHESYSQHKEWPNKKFGNMSGHGLIFQYSGNYTYIKLDEFKFNLKNETSKDVHGFFKSSGKFKEKNLGEKYKEIAKNNNLVVDK